ncbi:MAG: hypothetical protein LBD18_06810, partial [Treponema sp.]|jgi:hypothetical protein|nr:hypothetical protein [Treponema sp.]
MKKNVRNGVALLLAAIAVLALSGCPQPESFSSDVAISGVQIAGVKAITLGTPSTDWMQAVENYGHVFVPSDQLADAVDVQVSAPSGSTIFLAQAKSNVQPYFVSENSFTFEAEDFLFIEVFSENLDAYLIYAIKVHNRNPRLLDLTLSGRSAVGGQSAAGQPVQSFGKLGKPGKSWDTVEEEGEIAYATSQQGTALALTFKPEVETSLVRVAAAAADTAPVFSGAFQAANNGIISGSTVSPSDTQPYLYIELKGDSSFTDTTYYKIKMIAKGADTNLKTAKIEWYEGDTLKGSLPLVFGQKGTHSWVGSEAYGNYNNGAEVAAAGGTVSIADYVNSTSAIPQNFRAVLKVEQNDPNAELRYDYSKNQRDASLLFDKKSDLGRIVGGYYLGVEVESPIGEKGWYKFRLLSGRNDTGLGSLTIKGAGTNSYTISSLPAANAAVGGQEYVELQVTAADLQEIKVEARPPAGYESPISLGIAPRVGTAFATTSFDDNYTNNVTTFKSLESGQFLFIRVVSEQATEAYGSSGAAPTWSANAFYKVRFILQGAAVNATLASLKIGDANITLPAPNTVATGPSGETVGTEAVQLDTSSFSNVTFTAVPTDPKARVAYGFSSGNVTSPLADTDLQASGTFEQMASNTYLNVRVTSESGTVVNYYKVRVMNSAGPVAKPNAIKINGVSIGDVGTGNAANVPTTNTNPPAPVVIDHHIGSRSSFDEITVTVEGPNEFVDVAYSLNPDYYNFTFDSKKNTISDATDWSNTDGVFRSVSPAQYVYIRVTSADKTTILYFKVRLLLTGAQTGADLTSLTIGGVAISSTSLPGANTAVTGTTEITHYVPGANINVLNNLQISAQGSQGASAAYAMAAANNEATNDWSNTDGLFPTWQNGSWLVIRIASEDGMTLRYYKVRIVWGNNSAALTDIKINGASITGEGALPVANTAVTGTTAAVYHAANAAALTSLTAEAATVSPLASVAYAMASASNANTTDFSNTTGAFTPFTAANWLVIRVIAQDSITTNYYKVRIVVGNSSTELTGITVNSQPINQVPAANAAVTGTTAATYSSAVTLSPVTVTAAQAPTTGAAITYAAAPLDNSNTGAASFTTTDSFPGFISGQYVVIRVVSQDTLNTAYYKVQVIHGSPDIELEAIRVNGSYVVPVPQANTTVTGTNTGTLTVGSAADLAVLTVKVSVAPGVGVAYASAASSNANITNWTNTTGRFTNFTSGDYVVIRLVSQDAQSTEYYKVQVTAP